MGNFINLKNTKIGMLTPIEYIPGNRTAAGKWICKCECGNIKSIVAGKLTSKQYKSCGCQHYEMISRSLSKGYQQITGRYWSRLRRSANARGIPFDITMENAWNQFVNQNGLCSLTGELLVFDKKLIQQTASLDRRDNRLSYMPSNIQWIHKSLNKIKSDMLESEFIAWCSKVTRWRIR